MPSIANDSVDWLAVARTANEWERVTFDVRRQVLRDYEVGKVSFVQLNDLMDEMNLAYDEFSTEWVVANALYTAQQRGVPLETIVADLRREYQ